MRGLDPRIHDEVQCAQAVGMDCRVKPGNDEAISLRSDSGMTISMHG